MSGAKVFRRKQVGITGYKLTPFNLEEAAKFCGGEVLTVENQEVLSVPTLQGMRTAYSGDYVYLTLNDGRLHVRDAILFEQEFEEKPDYGVVTEPYVEPDKWFRRFVFRK